MVFGVIASSGQERPRTAQEAPKIVPKWPTRLCDRGQIISESGRAGGAAPPPREAHSDIWGGQSVGGSC
eukprot:9418473-Pyramimonas_sp.AAC.1